MPGPGMSNVNASLLKTDILILAIVALINIPYSKKEISQNAVKGIQTIFFIFTTAGYLNFKGFFQGEDNNKGNLFYRKFLKWITQEMKNIATIVVKE